MTGPLTYLLLGIEGGVKVSLCLASLNLIASQHVVPNLGIGTQSCIRYSHSNGSLVGTQCTQAHLVPITLQYKKSPFHGQQNHHRPSATRVHVVVSSYVSHVPLRLCVACLLPR